ncbi:MAG TPA: alpha/beta fold hydrolase, partial [Polyangiaceae bacterium]|nr:alpha/beta fold hydrolase [Polyangiaceae bacterium]
PNALLAADYRVITLDQRNAGQSWAPISAENGWHSYAEDHIALLDHLDAARCHVVGMCIGGAYALRLAVQHPDRVASAVLIQPIGLSANRQVFSDLFQSWREESLTRHPEAQAHDFDSFFNNMFGGDFAFSVTEAEVSRLAVPLLVLLGDDQYHPAAISRRIAEVAPRARLIEDWKQEPARSGARQEIQNFLREHTPR